MGYAGKINRSADKLAFEAGSQLRMETGAELVHDNVLKARRAYATPAQINQADGMTVVYGAAESVIKLIGFRACAVNGAAAGATALTIENHLGTVLASIPIAALTEDDWTDVIAAAGATMPDTIEPSSRLNIHCTGEAFSGPDGVDFVVEYLEIGNS